jgi:glycyl-tRNA synthetase
LPLGLAIVGKAYRNEISPRNLLIRMREFTQAELQIFFDPADLDKHERWEEVKNYKLIFLPASDRSKAVEISCEDVNKSYGLPKFYVWHLAKVQQFFLETLKIRKEDFRIKELSAEERAFYNKIHCDVELRVESLSGFKEVGGVHYRTAHDLSGHEKISGVSQKIFFRNKKFIPHVLELSFGIDRIVYALIELFYRKEKDRAILALTPQISPIQVAVFPLVKKDKLDDVARKIFEQLREEFDAVYDDSGSIGKRYYREDERGTPFCITVDYDTLKDSTVTVRDRDTTKQVRVKLEELVDYLRKSLKA